MPRFSFAFLLLTVLLLAGPHRLHAQIPVALEKSYLVGNGIACFQPKGFDPANYPLLALQKEPVAQGDVPADWKVHPLFAGDATHFVATVTVPDNVDFYGGGEVTVPLRRNGRTIELWNSDSFNYDPENKPQLYQSHPWMMGVRADGTAFGVLFDTSWKALLHATDNSVSLETEEGGPAFRVFVIDRDSPQAVLRGLAELTGTMQMPPLWALGYQQCRWSYGSAQEATRIADTFRSEQIPCDVIWLDIDYMDGYRVFTFNKQAFPDPAAFNDHLHQTGFHSVWMIDPGVKVDPAYSIYKSGHDADVFVHTKDGKEYNGSVWPGPCGFPDFTRPETAAWWVNNYQDFLGNGVDGVWNDMNEPAVFDVPSKTMPEDNQHRGGGGLPAGPHLLYHNAYGMLMVRATREGLLQKRPDKRPFVLSRANFLGGQRYGATWTGDNVSTDAYMKASIPMSLTLGLSGQPFSGPDLGGFSGSPTPELWANWVGFGNFFPFCRGHAERGTPSKEPYMQGPEVKTASRIALDRRYRLLPYLYTLFQHASTTGEPIMRPLFFADPKDPALRAEQDAFLIGDNLLVIPKWAGQIALPKGTWTSISLVDDDMNNKYQADLKIRGGGIVPTGKIVQNTGENYLDPLTLYIALDDNGQAKGDFYEDAGDGYGYQKGDYALEHITAMPNGAGKETVKIDSKDGNRPVPDRDVQIEIWTAHGVHTGHGSLQSGIDIAM
jgi:alpha-glucosidase